MTRRTRRRRTQSQRCVFSCAIVALLLAALLLPSELANECRDFRQGINVAKAIASDEEDVGEDMFGELGKARLREVPSTFLEEVIDVSNCSAVYVNNDGSIVGFSKVEPAQQTFLEIADELRSKGWVFVESGSRLAGSFVKSSGRYQWVFVSCTPVSGQTSVVVQTVSHGE